MAVEHAAYGRSAGALARSLALVLRAVAIAVLLTIGWYAHVLWAQFNTAEVVVSQPAQCPKADLRHQR